MHTICPYIIINGLSDEHGSGSALCIIFSILAFVIIIISITQSTSSENIISSAGHCFRLALLKSNN